jgi:hypothetical protein
MNEANTAPFAPLKQQVTGSLPKSLSRGLNLGLNCLCIYYQEEPLNGEALHKAIVLDRKSDVEKILDSSDGPRLLEIPDKFGNLPLMIAVNRNNLE